ncbi:MAG: histidine phosphatase family protein [Gemmatimonadetes bacterium]|nr:histidine phosphatase family protein [Gemmatimonadota bacterium]MBT8405724.1 histidine phosphatase family protein [Gemmatimonadota bacterium]NNK63561.1 histidine phosphatase family protein [Gemmatimonadota bacterium]
MKRLILLRHAKSSWDDPGLRDHERPLAPRGVRAVPEIARWMARHDYVPQLALCSDAVRTRQTWALVADLLGGTAGPPALSIEPDLYLASPHEIRHLVAERAGDVDVLLVIGHNPGMHGLALALAHPGSTEAARLAHKFPTAAVAVLDFDVDEWSELHPGTGRLVAFVRPKDLPGAADLRL